MANRATMKHWKHALWLLLPLFLFVSCVEFPRSGRVVSWVDGKPIEGVLVIETWMAEGWNPVDSRTFCSSAVWGITDKDGYYQTGWGIRSTPLKGTSSGLTVYKRGYYLQGLSRDTGAIEMRLANNRVDEVYTKGDHSFGLYCRGGQKMKRTAVCSVLREIAEDISKKATTELERREARYVVGSARTCEEGVDEAPKTKN